MRFWSIWCLDLVWLIQVLLRSNITWINCNGIKSFHFPEANPISFSLIKSKKLKLKYLMIERLFFLMSSTFKKNKNKGLGPWNKLRSSITTWVASPAGSVFFLSLSLSRFFINKVFPKNRKTIVLKLGRWVDSESG
jgi:hypothetical protein